MAREKTDYFVGTERIVIVFPEIFQLERTRIMWASCELECDSVQKRSSAEDTLTIIMGKMNKLNDDSVQSAADWAKLKCEPIT